MDNSTAYKIVKYKQIGAEMHGSGWTAAEMEKAKILADSHIARRVGSSRNTAGKNRLIDECQHYAYVDGNTVYDIRPK